MKPQRMRYETLEERVATILRGAVIDDEIQTFEQAAQAVLAALGLDDIDAAVERMADHVSDETYNRDGDRAVARAALEAALLATPESEES